MKKQAQEIVKFFKRIYDKNLTTASGGNISSKIGKIILVSPTEKDKAELKADDLAFYDNLKNVFLNNNKPTSEFSMHKKIYDVRDDVKAIIHAHPEFTSIFSILDTPLNINLLSESAIFLKDIAYVDYFLPSSEKLAEAVQKAAKNSDTIILRNHGALVLGSSLIDCFHKLEVLELAAKTHFRVLGRKDVNSLSDEDLTKIRKRF